MTFDDYRTFYVYEHRHPETKELVYVGMGQKDRAWIFNVRSVEHQDWMRTLQTAGYTPADWVVILEKGLTKDQALLKEEDLITHHKPTFNKCKNVDYLLSKRNESLVGVLKGLREMGYSYTHIAFLSGADGVQSRKNTKAMSVWRMVNDVVR